MVFAETAEELGLEEILARTTKPPRMQHLSTELSPLRTLENHNPPPWRCSTTELKRATLGSYWGIDLRSWIRVRSDPGGRSVGTPSRYGGGVGGSTWAAGAPTVCVRACAVSGASGRETGHAFARKRPPGALWPPHAFASRLVRVLPYSVEWFNATTVPKHAGIAYRALFSDRPARHRVEFWPSAYALRNEGLRQDVVDGVIE